MTRAGRREVRGSPADLRSGLGGAPWLLLFLFLFLGAGCGTFPISMYVDDEVFELLEQTSFQAQVDDEEIVRELSHRPGGDVERVPHRGKKLHRVDAAPGVPFAPAAADDPSSPHVAGLRSGDVLLAKNFKAQSLATTLSFEEFTFYNHLGLLVIEDGAAWVYESWPKLHLIGPANEFIDRFRGTVKRIRLGDFLKRYETVRFVRLPDEERNARAVEAARRSLELGIPYDPHHDPKRPGLSCSEYLEVLFVEEADSALVLEPRAIGYNLALARMSHALGFRTPAYLVPDSFAEVDGARTVGVISVHRSAMEVRAMREAFVVLHAHNRPESPAGDYVEIHPWSFLVYRPTTRAFLEWTKGWARTHPDASDEELRAAIEVLYGLCFRPVEP